MCWKGVLSAFLAVSGVLLSMGCGGGSSNSGGNGGGGGNNKSAEFLYATTGCCVIQMQLDTSSGNLSVPAFAGSGITGYGLAATPSKSFLYANSSNGVYGFSLASTGLLTPLSSSPMAYPGSPVFFNYQNDLTIVPSGKFLYSAYNDSSSLSAGAAAAFSIDATGNLTPVPGSPFIAGNLPVATAVDPAGNYLYVANENSGSVSVFGINPNTGALTETAGSPVVTSNSEPVALSMHPSGKFLYVLNYSMVGGLAGFSVDSTSGGLVPLPGSPWLTSVVNPRSVIMSSIAMHPSGSFLYVADVVGDIYAFSVNSATGGLTLASGSPFGNFSSLDPYILAIDPSGKYLYQASLGFYPGMASFQIDGSTGALTPAGTPDPGYQHIGPGTLGLLPLKLP